MFLINLDILQTCLYICFKLETTKAMNKPTKKRQAYNAEIIRALVAEFEVSSQFVRQAIRGDKQSLTAETIRKKYKELAKPTQNAIENFKKQPI